MRKLRTPNQEGPESVAADVAVTRQAARERRSARALEGWLASRMRSAAAARRRAAADKDRAR
ncbi:MAG: hypothetical protein M3071_16380 [Actinomycetota bacterium]|nr:hypothetical protein [Actinomycetota bacterium]